MADQFVAPQCTEAGTQTIQPVSREVSAQTDQPEPDTLNAITEEETEYASRESIMEARDPPLLKKRHVRICIMQNQNTYQVYRTCMSLVVLSCNIITCYVLKYAAGICPQ